MDIEQRLENLLDQLENPKLTLAEAKAIEDRILFLVRISNN